MPGYLSNDRTEIRSRQFFQFKKEIKYLVRKDRLEKKNQKVVDEGI